MEPITLAVVSDLHVGAGARASDLCLVEDTKILREKDYLETFSKFIKQRGITADYLVVPGDISNSAQPDEFRVASEGLRKIAESLSVPAERLIIVPGNHDVDWSILKLHPTDKSGLRFRQRYDPLCQSECIFQGAFSRASCHTMIADPYFCIWEFGNLVVVGHNSSLHDGPDADVHHGLIPLESIQKLDEALSAINLSREKLKLFVVHHHPIPYSDPIPDEPDFSAMTNAENLLSILRKYKFDLIIHGHKHKPNFNTYTINSTHPIAILGAGSFSYRLDFRWSGMVNNQFHLVRIKKRDLSSELICGFVESYTYLSGHGWGPSAPHNGIAYTKGFGKYALPGELRNHLRPLLRTALGESNFVRWEAFAASNTDLEYLQQDQILSVLTELEGELGFKRYSDIPSEMILLKE